MFWKYFYISFKYVNIVERRLPSAVVYISILWYRALEIRLSAIREASDIEGSAIVLEMREAPMSEGHPVYRVPQLPKLPSEGVQFAGMTESAVHELMKRLTALVFCRIKK